MSQITGTVRELFEGVVSSGRSAGMPFWSITLDTDAKLTTFNADYIEGVVVGGEYTFTVKASGDYINLTAPTVPAIQTGIPPSEEPVPLKHPAPKMPVAKPSTPKPKIISKGYGYRETQADYRARQVSIRKAVALKAGVEYVASALGGTGTTEDIIGYAAEFEKYLE